MRNCRQLAYIATKGNYKMIVLEKLGRLYLPINICANVTVAPVKHYLFVIKVAFNVMLFCTV